MPSAVDHKLIKVVCMLRRVASIFSKELLILSLLAGTMPMHLSSKPGSQPS